MSDAFTFFCDLDRDLPSDKRAALTVSHDGEHLVCNFSQGATDTMGREVYLTPNMAAGLAYVVNALVRPDDASEDAAPDGLKVATKLAGIVLLFAVAVGMVAVGVGRLTS